MRALERAEGRATRAPGRAGARRRRRGRRAPSPRRGSSRARRTACRRRGTCGARARPAPACSRAARTARRSRSGRSSRCASAARRRSASATPRSPGRPTTPTGSPDRSCAGRQPCDGACTRAVACEAHDVRRGCRGARVARAGALQHRRRRLRQASARQARDGPRALRRRASARCSGASCRTSPTRPRTCCAPTASQRGDRVAVVLPPTPETAAIFFGTWKLGALLLSMSVLYGDDGIRHRLSDSTPAVLVTDAANAPRFDRSERPGPRRRPARRRADRLRSRRTRRRRPGAALLHVRHDRAGQGHRPRAPLPARARGVRSTATRCRTASASTAWASGRGPPASRRCSGPWRLGAVQCVYQREGGFDPHKQLDFLSRHEVTNVFTTPTAMRSMMAIGDAGTRYPQQFRRVCSPGEPLNPEAIRWFREQYGLTVLDYYGLTESYPLVRELPVHGRPRGLDGPADARLGRADPRRGRAAGRRRASAARSACARARTRTTRSATGTTTRPPRRPSAASGSTPRTPPRWTRTATSGTRAAPTT